MFKIFTLVTLIISNINYYHLEKLKEESKVNNESIILFEEIFGSFHYSILKCITYEIIENDNSNYLYYIMIKKLFNDKKHSLIVNFKIDVFKLFECKSDIKGIKLINFNYYFHYLYNPKYDISHPKTLKILNDFKNNDLISKLISSWKLEKTKNLNLESSYWNFFSKLKNYCFNNKNNDIKNFNFITEIINYDLFSVNIYDLQYNYMKKNIKKNKEFKKLELQKKDYFNFNSEDIKINLGNFNNDKIGMEGNNPNNLENKQNERSYLNYYKSVKNDLMGSLKTKMEKFIELEENYFKSDEKEKYVKENYEDYLELANIFPNAFLKIYNYELSYNKDYNKLYDLLEIQTSFNDNIVTVLKSYFFSIKETPYFNIIKSLDLININFKNLNNQFIFEMFGNILLNVQKILLTQLLNFKKPKKLISSKDFLNRDLYHKVLNKCYNVMLKSKEIYSRIIKVYNILNFNFFEYYIFNTYLLTKYNFKEKFIDFKFFKIIINIFDYSYYDIFISKSYNFYKDKNYLDSIKILNYCSLLGCNICTYRLYKLLNSKQLKKYDLNEIKEQNKKLILKNKTIDLILKIYNFKNNSKKELSVLKKIFKYNKSNENLFYILDNLANNKNFEQYNIYFKKILNKINKNKFGISDYVYVFKN